MANTPSSKYRFFEPECGEILTSELDEHDIVLPLNHEPRPWISLLGYIQFAGALSLPIIFLITPYLDLLSAILLPEPVEGFAFSK